MTTHSNQSRDKLRPFSENPEPVYEVLSWTFLAYGLVLRLRHYWNNRSLWHDEAAISLNIINRSYGALLDRLDHAQAAPPLFLWAEKWVTQLWDSSEYALRLLPVIASLISLALFYQLLRRFASEVARPIAMGLFACIGYGVYFAAEVKPYTVDGAIALAIFLTLLPLRGQLLSLGQRLGFSGLGGLAIWLSYPSVFMLVAAEATHWVGGSKRQLGRVLVNRLPVYGVWLLSFAVLYFGVIQKTLSDETLVSNWQQRYPDSWLDFVWLLDAIGRFFYRPLGFTGIAEAIAAVAFLSGCIWLYRQQRDRLILLLLPIGVTLAAGYLRQYPFRERLILFLAPFALVIVAEGIAWPLRQQWLPLRACGWVLLGTLLLPAAWQTGAHVFNPERIPLFHAYAIRPAVIQIQSNWLDTDTLYISSRAELPFRYYAQRYDFFSEQHVYGKQRLPDADAFTSQYLTDELNPLVDASRVWLLFVLQSRALPSPEALLNALNLYFQGSPVEVLKTSNTLTCLYDLDDLAAFTPPRARHHLKTKASQVGYFRALSDKTS